MILTSAIIKTIASLDKAPHRRREGLFMVEGTKAVADTIGRFDLHMLACTAAWEQAHPELVGPREVTRTTMRDLSRMSHMSTPPRL